MFNAGRWVAEWEALGGTFIVFTRPVNDEMVTSLIEQWPGERPADDVVLRIRFLRRQLTDTTRDAVVDFLTRRAATRGW